jgi:F420H(2)-dependent quinone reductase
MPEPSTTYRKPGAVTRQLMNPLLVLAMRAGVGVWGGRVLAVRGRKSGEIRCTPVNLLNYGGLQYLVSPRGDSQWARNVRADKGRLVLILGRRRDERVATELSDEDKPPVLRAYLKKWKMEVGVFFDGVSAASTDAELLRIAPRHPVFVLSDKQS